MSHQTGSNYWFNVSLMAYH